MKLPIYKLDAFTASVFRGNPAAVVPLHSWLPDGVMQSMAAENNLSETAFFVANGPDWDLRWFTPKVEVDLCGHATLASGYVILNQLQPDAEVVVFQTRSGRLSVSRRADLLALDFPAMPAERLEDKSVLEAVERALGPRPTEVWRARDLMAVYASSSDVETLSPDMAGIKRLDSFAVMATAPDEQDGTDFVSRFFAPAKGIDEDPVTGSAHCTLGPYWAERLRRDSLTAHQISPRGGRLQVEISGERVIIAGAVTPYLEGTIQV